MTPGRITLQTWLAQNYAAGEGPTLDTARRWARAGKLEPPAVKEGRTYYVDPAARYTPVRTTAPRRTVLQRILDGEAKDIHAPGPA